MPFCHPIPTSFDFWKLRQDSQIMVTFRLSHNVVHTKQFVMKRDLSTITSDASLTSVGSISSHTRPVECLDAFAQSNTSAILYTADTMGVIKIWELTKDQSTPPRWRSTLKAELSHHRTRINELYFGNGQLWTGD
jgi:hypothetical protein